MTTTIEWKKFRTLIPLDSLQFSKYLPISYIHMIFYNFQIFGDRRLVQNCCI